MRTETSRKRRGRERGKRNKANEKWKKNRRSSDVKFYGKIQRQKTTTTTTKSETKTLKRTDATIMLTKKTAFYRAAHLQNNEL